MTAANDRPKSEVNTHYKWVLLAVVIAFFSSLIAYEVLSGLWSQPNEQQKHGLDVLDTTIKTTLGAFTGLVGGKTAS